MPPIIHNFSSISELEQNPKEVFLDSTAVLIRIGGNILRDPANPKFRSLLLGSNVFTSKLLPVVGAVECLFEMGFVEGSNKLELPVNTPLDNLKKIHNELVTRRDKVNKSQNAGGSKEAGKSTSDPKQPPPKTSNNEVIIHIGRRKQSPEIIKIIQDLTKYQDTLTNNFLKGLISHSMSVLNYEDMPLQIKALKCIPLVELNLNVEKNMRQQQQAVKQGLMKDPCLDYHELLLLELISWFKNSFFEWVDTLKCTKCDLKTKASGTSNILIRGADRVEKHVCPQCNDEQLFPRYNDPKKLLKTRRGRCGEWANCFTLLCRAMGWDARHVVDTTDHVWTEVYIQVKNTWVHCDPCENVVDAPLLYEAGWKKQLSYVLGYSREGVQDVTWRYSSQHATVLKRRRLCTETDLLNVITHVRNIMCEHETQARKTYVTKRCALELVELMKPRKVTQAELQGRTSGSLAWRLARGDTHLNSHVWRVQDKDIVDGAFHLTYCPSTDEYRIGGTETVLNGWQNGVQLSKGVFRKVETDWLTVYLARQERQTKGLIAWNFHLDNKSIDSLSIRFETTIFQSGLVSVRICSGDVCVRVPDAKASAGPIFETTAFRGCKTVTVTAELSGGDGDCAWQHAQLFRQQVESTDTPFSLTIRVKAP